MEKGSIIVSWSSPDGDEFDVGVLERFSDVYYFWYIGDGVREAEQKGFRLFPEFAFRERVYLAYELFGTFSSRLPDRSRRDIDPFDLLAASGSRLPYDCLNFRRSN